MGGHSEKLLTLEEAARYLGIPPDDVEALIRSGRLASFRLGGCLLRLRLSDVEALRRERSDVSPPASVWDRIRDFVYFNDFYLIAFLIILGLVVLIVSL